MAEASRGKDGDEAALENVSAFASGVSHFSTASATADLLSERNGNPKANPQSQIPTKRKTTSEAANEVITDSEVITDLKRLQPNEVGALSSGQAASPQRSPRASASEIYREAIELGLRRGRNAVAIWQDLVDQNGFASSYQSAQRFVRKLHGTQTPEARVVITTPPGQEAQVDYGTGTSSRIRGSTWRKLSGA